MIMIDRFSVGIDELKIKEQRDISAVLRVLHNKKRFSVFEATANQVIANTMMEIMQKGYAKIAWGNYPWTEVEITERGRAAMQAKGPK